MISPRELAEMLGVPVQTVYDWNHLGAGPRYSRFGRHVRYAIADIEAWIAASAVDRSDRRRAA
ncbi:AlpA family transcriptional regulator [Streptomyces sp. M54]|uniref:helix-turn-helix transcriptional regulator n=1 Tax=Streptomyces sp. M54 TaxID=2759525 RepID=UPI001A8C0CD5|nr:helix-turn-helix domain-containing protein [Streptomyces sp. M54]QSS93553.1 helix-turn-helix domain-containing protein [Streptomyces sp. M54]